jgi:hypothetical protein
MIDEIFKEIFESEMDLLDKFEKSANKFNDEVEDEKGSSYFHKITEEYEDGKCVSRSEKEIKDGKVIKDVHEAHSLKQDKPKAIENGEDKVEDKEDFESYYKRKIENLCKKIDEKNEVIDKLNARCSKLMEENDKIKFTLRDLIK